MATQTQDSDATHDPWRGRCPVEGSEIWTYQNRHGWHARADYLVTGPHPSRARAESALRAAIQELQRAAALEADTSW